LTVFSNFKHATSRRNLMYMTIVLPIWL